jgi:hypothetical protein
MANAALICFLPCAFKMRTALFQVAGMGECFTTLMRSGKPMLLQVIRLMKIPLTEIALMGLFFSITFYNASLVDFCSSVCSASQTLLHYKSVCLVSLTLLHRYNFLHCIGICPVSLTLLHCYQFLHAHRYVQTMFLLTSTKLTVHTPTLTSCFICMICIIIARHYAQTSFIVIPALAELLYNTRPISSCLSSFMVIQSVHVCSRVS